MANIRMMFGQSKANQEKKIKDMEVGDIGYTVEWAIDEKTGILNTEYPISEKGGTLSVKVTCIGDGFYDVVFEKPIYRNIITGKFDE